MNQLLEKIEYFNGGFPKKELNEIIYNKEQYIPELLSIMKNVPNNYKKYLNENYFIHLYASYLLAQFREKVFFDIIIDIMELPYPIPDKLYGDSLTEDVGRMIASTYDGNIERIYKLIENSSLDVFTRSTGISALEVLI